MRFLPVTSRAMLIEMDDLDATLALFDALRTASLAQIAEVIPAARTLLIRCAPGCTSTAALAGQIAALAQQGDAQAGDAARPAPIGDPIEVPVTYDGADLDDVARLMDLSVAEVIAAHQSAIWQVAFCGFAPGFAYMTCADARFDLPRRSSPRKAIPAGSVALAGRFCGVYPQETPGGWQLIGRTAVPMWDLSRDPPALLRPGTRARFVDAGRRVAVAPVAVAPVKTESAAPALRVLSTLFPILMQDRGRHGQTGQGVSASGALDQGAMARANRAVGNAANTAVMEITAGPVRLQAHAPLTLALTGAARARVGDRVIAPGAAFAVDAGDQITILPPDTGMRSYLALRGGFDVAPVMGSASTDTLAFIGPDVLTDGMNVGACHAPAMATGTPEPQPPLPAPGDLVTLPVTLGPRADWFTPDMVARFLAQEWRVTQDLSRVGIRLAGDHAITRDGPELPSEGTETGAIQIPHSGQPVLFLADHPLTGGYPVIATLHPSALDLAGQIPPGARIRFTAAAPFSDIQPHRSA